MVLTDCFIFETTIRTDINGIFINGSFVQGTFCKLKFGKYANIFDHRLLEYFNITDTKIAFQKILEQIYLKNNDSYFNELIKNSYTYDKFTKRYCPLSEFIISKLGSRFRTNGTILGRKLQQELYRVENEKFLRYIQSGTITTPLIDAYSREAIERIVIIDYNYIMEEAIIMGYALHHIIYSRGNGSEYKNETLEPSELITRKKLSLRDKIELLRTLPLSPSNHLWHHAAYQKKDYNFWNALWKTGRGKRPWAWENVENFNKCCEKFNITGITYEEFIKSMIW